MTAFEAYLCAISEIHASGAGVKETSYYPPLSAFLNEVGKKLKPNIRCIINLANHGAGIPDGGFSVLTNLRIHRQANLLKAKFLHEG